ncbi:MAG: hypothetical protein FJ087_00155 [Deltaproteobacteria bacterium]|nr:hypothetical protein [Deltaproteobacteria bacterium]
MSLLLLALALVPALAACGGGTSSGTPDQDPGALPEAGWTDGGDPSDGADAEGAAGDDSADAGTIPCSIDDDCAPLAERLAACRVPRCGRSGTCEAVPAGDGSPCGDAEPCRPDGLCVSGACMGRAKDCDDHNPCTDDTCEPGVGCRNAPNRRPCDDGNPCTSDDVCADGSCGGHNECQCGGDAECAAHEDQNRCNGTLRCSNGLCEVDPATVVVCDPRAPGACRVPACDPLTGACVEADVPDGRPCDDLDACTVGDACLGGACVALATIHCDDNNPCTNDGCDPSGGCVRTPRAGDCDDGNACTLDDRCDAYGKCVGVPTPECGCLDTAGCAPLEDGDRCNGTLACVNHACVVAPATVVACDTSGDGPCSRTACVPATGECAGTPAPEGRPCDDGNACSSASACQAGECVPLATLSCDDGNVCTGDSCDPGQGCRHDPVAGACDDGDPCTGPDNCAWGTCNPLVRGCDDLDPCTTDVCDPVEGCVHQAITGACEDGNACTAMETCVDGKCVGGVPVSCDDGNPCTDDPCDPAGGCRLHPPNTVPCDDGDPCTGDEHCSQGACVPGGPRNCDDGDPCTAERCDPGVGCVRWGSGAACDDGNPCSLDDACADGGCAPGEATTCDDGNPCTTDSCDAVAGCVHADAPPGTGCDDGDACTGEDVCLPGGKCRGTFVVCDDGNPCTLDRCVPAIGCVADDLGHRCDDGSPCTEGDRCRDGTCEGVPKGCDDGNPCTADRCDPVVGCVWEPRAAACDDGNACTAGDACQGYVCLPGPRPDCDDLDPCTLDRCLPAAGCRNDRLLGIPCDDGDPCTVKDRCLATGCGGGRQACDDGNPCTTDLCLPYGGCVHEPSAAGPCDDGSVCTTGDACEAGRCRGVATIDCSDQDQCTLDWCDPVAGCTHKPRGYFPCSDGSACTIGDHCDPDGRCTGAPLACDDRNDCTADGCDAAKGCFATPLPGNACDDGDPCSESDACGEDGVCRGEPRDCDDGRLCTRDFCDPGAASGCRREFNYLPCDDGDACTVNDRCGGGECRGYPGPGCDDGNPCTDDACDPAGGCRHDPNTRDCDDGDACTSGDKCAGGRCAGWPVPCGDENPCTHDACDPRMGCTRIPKSGASCASGDRCLADAQCSGYECVGTQRACDDDNPCTKDSCLYPGECVFLPLTGVSCGFGGTCEEGHCVGVPDCADGNPCTFDRFNGETCDHLPRTGPCDDGDACTSHDSCIDGACLGRPRNCDDHDPCTLDDCDPKAGCTFAAVDGLDCDDGNPCTDGDACSAGTCGGVRKPCDDDNPCTADRCDVFAEPGIDACVHEPIQMACDDGDPCTDGDFCFDAVCRPGAIRDCHDDNPCTVELCDPVLGCVREAASGGGDDGNACTAGDRCSGEACTGEPISCDDGNPCTADWCDRAWGCRSSPVPGAPCRDSNACTADDRCTSSGACSGSPVVCDDGNACTDDSCSPAAGCVSTPNSLPCDDRNECTSNDRCEGGGCLGGEPVRCEDGNVCTEDRCDPVWGCTFKPADRPCEDGNPCTAGDRCLGGTCVPGGIIACNDANPCTTDSCQSGKGCVFHLTAGQCDDGDACTEGDRCLDGQCRGTDPKDCSDDNPCTVERCLPGSGCVWEPVDHPCDDKDPCTLGDGCSGGGCRSGPPLVCDDANPCTADACTGGQCVFQPEPGPVPCEDGNACTTGDFCQAGYCTPGRPVRCGDEIDPCVRGSCSPALGCVESFTTLPCDDHDPCTRGEGCRDGACSGGAAVSCDDGDPCTDDLCRPGEGCEHLPAHNVAKCDDGDPCTGGDVCTGAGCAGTWVVDCDDHAYCTIDRCDPGVGCVHEPRPTGDGCDDSDECTSDDRCADGRCAGTAVDCDDGNPCTFDGCERSSGCLHRPNALPCPGGRCEAGECRPVPGAEVR